MDNIENQTNRKMPRGAQPSPRNVLAAAKPHQIIGTTPANFIYRPATLSFWGNNTYGDCVTAEEAFAKACSNPEIFIPDTVAISWAQSNGWLEGAVISNVLQMMDKRGFLTNSVLYNDGEYNAVDWHNEAVLQNAISIGPVKIGVSAEQLNAAYRQNNGWFATGFTTELVQDHCISLCGYGTLSWLANQFGVSVPSGVDGQGPGYAFFTWNSIGIIDQKSMLAITSEAWLRNPTTIAIGSYQTRILEVATTFGNENDGTWFLNEESDLVFIKTANTANGHVEVHIASKASNYQTRILEAVTTFANENDGTWLLTSAFDLVFIKTANTANGHVEVHIASRASNYQTRILEVATTFANENDGIWLLTSALDLVFIKTANTANGHVEVHVASRASNYQTRILEVATTFANENDGTWTLDSNSDLVFIKTSNTQSDYVEVHIASRTSNYQQRILEVPTTFVNENDGVWTLTSNTDLVFIRTSNTPSGHVEVHIAAR